MTNTQVPGSFGMSPLAPLSLSGSPIESIDAAVALNERVLGAQRQVSENRFWSSTQRQSTDPTREIYALTLNTQQEINFISLELPRFPHRTWVQYFDEASSTWKSVQDLDTTQPVAFTITDSLPAQFLALADQQAKIHPQHYGAGHWVLFKHTFRTVKASRFRLVMARVPGVAPIGRDGLPAAYSLGVRNCYFGFDATDVNLIPRTPFATDTEHEPFAGAVDALRSTLSYALRENLPHSILSGGVWRSEPQPIRNAVVNFYVDARDEVGLPQVIDRFFVDPLYTGPKANLYYSDTPLPLPNGEASDLPLRTGERMVVDTGVDPSGTGLLFGNSNGSLSASNTGVRFDPSQPWWIGITFQPQFTSSEPNDHVIIATSDNSLEMRWSSVNQAWVLKYNQSATSLADVFGVNWTLSYALIFDGEKVSLTSATDIFTNNGVILGDPAVAWPGNLPETINFGTNADRSEPMTGNYRLINMVAKNVAPSMDDLNTYFADPLDYVVKKPYPYQDDNSTNGSLLRFADPFKTIDQATGTGFWGFVGEPLIDYDSMVWTPVNRDFELRRGMWAFNPVKAAAFKFEFYDLSPQNYDSQTVLTRTVRLFPVTTPTVNLRLDPTNYGAPAAKGGAGSSVNVNSALDTPAFVDAGPITVAREGAVRQQYSPTEVMYAEDPTIADRIRVAGTSTDYMRWVESPERFRFTGPQVHYYRFVDVKHDHRVAFFAGLKSLEMYRLAYESEDDTDQYLEVFHDTMHITPAPGYPSALGFLAGSGLYSSQADTLTVQAMASTTFASRRRVRAVQFATTQSDAYQMLVNPDFDDISLLGWSSIGDATIEPSTAFNSTIGTTVKVVRGLASNTWNDVMALFPTWADITQDETWNSIMHSASTSGSGGITSVDYETPSTIGRLYAAARVYSPDSLSFPLSLQIINDSGQVLAEADKRVVGGSVTEWYVGYTIGEGGATDGRTWAEVETDFPTWHSFTDAGVLWRDVQNSTLALTGNVSARLIQKDASTDVFYVDNISLFDDPIVWDFTVDDGAHWYPAYDIRNNPRGIFVLPTPGKNLRWRVRIGRGGAWVSAVDIRPQYAELPLGIAFREGVERGNGNIGHWDHYNPILVDPRYKMWDKPVPEWWWFVNRQWLLHQTPVSTFKSTTLRETIIASGPPPSSLSLEDVVVIPPASAALVLGETLPAT